mgnify:CR=1 FL=1
MRINSYVCSSVKVSTKPLRLAHNMVELYLENKKNSLLLSSTVEESFEMQGFVIAPTRNTHSLLHAPLMMGTQ